MIGRAVRHVFAARRMMVHGAALSPDRGRMPDRLGALRFRPLNDEDFSRDDVFAEKDRRARFGARLGTPHRCFGFVNDDGTVASYLWITVAGREPALAPWQFGLQAEILPAQAYVWDCRTADRFQLHGLYRQGLERAKAICAAAGAGLAMIDCARDNAASRRGILSAGFAEWGEVLVLRIGGARVLLGRGVGPRVLGPGARVRLSSLAPPGEAA